MRFEFINAEKANYPVRVMCRVLQVRVGALPRDLTRWEQDLPRAHRTIGQVEEKGKYGSSCVSAEKATMSTEGMRQIVRAAAGAGALLRRRMP